jgi:hypothetical protein
MVHRSRATVSSQSRAPLPEQLITWLKSSSGCLAVSKAVSKSQNAVKSLNEARKVQPEQLHEPITL